MDQNKKQKIKKFIENIIDRSNYYSGITLINKIDKIYKKIQNECYNYCIFKVPSIRLDYWNYCKCFPCTSSKLNIYFPTHKCYMRRTWNLYDDYKNYTKYCFNPKMHSNHKAVIPKYCYDPEICDHNCNQGNNQIEPIIYSFEEPKSIKECLEIDLNYIKDKINKFKSKIINNCNILINVINKKTIKTCKKMIIVNSITKLKKNFSIYKYGNVMLSSWSINDSCILFDYYEYQIMNLKSKSFKYKDYKHKNGISTQLPTPIKTRDRYYYWTHGVNPNRQRALLIRHRKVMIKEVLREFS